MALEEHFLDAGGEGEVPFQREGPICQLRPSRPGLVAVGMKAVRQAEAGREGPERRGRSVTVKGAGLKTPQPGVRIAAPPIRADPIERGQRVPDDRLFPLSLRPVDEPERMEGHEVGEMTVGLPVREPGGEHQA